MKPTQIHQRVIFALLLFVHTQTVVLDSNSSSFHHNSPSQSAQTQSAALANPDRQLSVVEDHPTPQLSVDDLTPDNIRLIMQRLKHDDRPFFKKLKQMTFKDQQSYLLLNKERLLVTAVAQRSGGKLLVGAIRKIAMMRKQKAELAELRKIINERRQERYFSKISKRKEIEALQSSIYQLENALSTFRDIVDQKSLELNYSIGSNVGNR